MREKIALLEVELKQWVTPGLICFAISSSILILVLLAKGSISIRTASVERGFAVLAFLVATLGAFSTTRAVLLSRKLERLRSDAKPWGQIAPLDKNESGGAFQAAEVFGFVSELRAAMPSPCEVLHAVGQYRVPIVQKSWSPLFRSQASASEGLLSSTECCFWRPAVLQPRVDPWLEREAVSIWISGGCPVGALAPGSAKNFIKRYASARSCWLRVVGTFGRIVHSRGLVLAEEGEIYWKIEEICSEPDWGEIYSYAYSLEVLAGNEIGWRAQRLP